MSAIKHHHHHTIEAAQRPKQRPILFTTDMVRAIINGRKTQTRRIMKLRDGHLPDDGSISTHLDGSFDKVMDFSKTFPYWKELHCPYGHPGDHLYVRETWASIVHEGGYAYPSHVWKGEIEYIYRADFGPEPVDWNWKPSIHMPRAAARITLLITDIRAQRLHDITEADARAEGVEQGYAAISARHSYFTLWEKINGPGSWEQNPWVWVISFKKFCKF